MHLKCPHKCRLQLTLCRNATGWQTPPLGKRAGRQMGKAGPCHRFKYGALPFDASQMAVAWFGQLRLELVRRNTATELCNTTDCYEFCEWSKTGGIFHKHSIDWTVDPTTLDLDEEMLCLQAEVAKRVEAGATDTRLHMRGVTEFIKIAETYVSEWKECKDAGGDPNKLASEVRAYIDRSDHPAAVTHADLMRMCGCSCARRS